MRRAGAWALRLPIAAAGDTVRILAGVPEPRQLRRARRRRHRRAAGARARLETLQRHLQRLLAFSTVAHVGLFVCWAAMADPAGTAGAAVYIAGQAGAKAALFLLAGLIPNSYGGVDERTLHGRGRGAWLPATLFGLGAVALAGLPPWTLLGVTLGGLRRLHSGHVGDYIAWLFLGVGALAALLGLPLVR